MIKLFLDIETLLGDELLREVIESEIKPPENISRPERIKQWEDEEKPAKVEQEYRSTALILLCQKNSQARPGRVSRLRRSGEPGPESPTGQDQSGMSRGGLTK